jgi:hypothetical protein
MHPGDTDRGRPDELLRKAIARTADRLLEDPRQFNAMREEDLRTALCEELNELMPGRVRRERTLQLACFQGVGGFDVLVDQAPEAIISMLAETKWSYSSRDKIFEAAWDAVKLCLAQDEHGAHRCWLVTGASEDSWGQTECADLFSTGQVDFRQLWVRPLVPPGPNGGHTVGEDLKIGGRGNMFTRAPEGIAIEEIAHAPLVRGAERWLLRASAVSPLAPWFEFAQAPRFPARIDDRWLRRNVAALDDETFGALLDRLRAKRWTEDELRRRVLPLRSGTTAGAADALASNKRKRLRQKFGWAEGDVHAPTPAEEAPTHGRSRGSGLHTQKGPSEIYYDESLSVDERERLLKEYKGTAQWPEALGYLGGLAREDLARRLTRDTDPDASP